MKQNVLNETIEYRNYKESDYESYSTFCENNFGKKNYQRNSSYLKWLYEDTINSFSVAVNNNTITGIIHKFKAPIEINGQFIKVTVLHDLMVDSKYRSGAGLHLMQSGLYSDEYVVLPGSVGRLSRAYGRLGSKPFNSFWYKKFQMPKGLYSLNKVKSLNRYKSLAKNQGLTFGHNKENNKDFHENALKKYINIECCLDYFKWRFFHKNAPLTFYVSDESRENTVLFVIGKRGFLPYVRIFYVSSENEVILGEIVQFIETITAKIGISVVLFTTFEASPPKRLMYRQYKEIPISYVFSKNKNHDFIPNVPTFCSDIGFDGINPFENI